MRGTAVLAIAFVLAGTAFGQASHMHREPCKRAAQPSVDQKLTDRGDRRRTETLVETRG